MNFKQLGWFFLFTIKYGDYFFHTNHSFFLNFDLLQGVGMRSPAAEPFSFVEIFHHWLDSN